MYCGSRLVHAYRDLILSTGGWVGEGRRETCRTCVSKKTAAKTTIKIFFTTPATMKVTPLACFTTVAAQTSTLRMCACVHVCIINLLNVSAFTKTKSFV